VAGSDTLMRCRQCGTEIADKAIVCYRCGAATTDPVRKPAPIRRKRSPILSFVVLVALTLLALFQGYVYRTAPEPEPLRLYLGIGAAMVVLILLVRIIVRRR
jgi:hypothetical protein